MSYLGEDIKKLGFGLMRLPQQDRKIDIEQTKTMVDKFLEAGFTYMKDFNGLSDAEEETIKKAQEILKTIPIIPCTTCNYCAKVCPMKIGISGSLYSN